MRTLEGWGPWSQMSVCAHAHRNWAVPRGFEGSKREILCSAPNFIFSIEESKLPKGYPCLVRLYLPCSSNKLSLEEEMALSCEKRWKT